MDQPVTLTEAAAALGVHKSTISRQVSAGVIPNHGTARAPKVRVSEARLARAGAVDPAKQRGSGAPLFADPGEHGANGVRPSRSPDDAEDDDAPGTPPGPGGVSFTKARTAREAANARLAQIDLEERLGRLLDKREVEDVFFTLSTIVRDELMGQGARLAGDLVGMTEPGEIVAKIDAANRDLLARLEREFKRLAEPDAAAA